MQVTKAITGMMEVRYTVTDSGGYVFMDTFTYPTVTPLTTKQVDAKIAADYLTWRKVMDTPIPEPTVEILQAELVRVDKEIVAYQQKKVALSAQIATIEKPTIIDDGIISKDII